MTRLLHTCLLVFLLLPVASAQTAQQNSLVIKGQVLDDQERPVSGARVVARPDGGLRGRMLTATSDSRGEFSIAVYKSDSFRVTASKPADGYPDSATPFYYPIENSLAHVWVIEGQAAPFATVLFGPKAGNITGHIVDTDTGQGVNDFQITLCRAEAPKYCYKHSTKQARGQFSVLVPAAPFTVQVSAVGYEDWFGADPGERHAESIQVGPGTTKQLSMTLARLSSGRDGANPAVLGPPQPLLPADRTELSHYPRTTRLEWSPVSGAASYSVELEVCEMGSTDGNQCGLLLQMRGNPPLSGIEGTSYEFLFIGAQPGRWRVWAVDAKGRVGLKSRWSMFFYKQ